MTSKVLFAVFLAYVAIVEFRFTVMRQRLRALAAVQTEMVEIDQRIVDALQTFITGKPRYGKF